MRKELEQYLPVAKALGELLHPYAEIVIHDIDTRKVAAIVNNYSGRFVGDDSTLDSNTSFEEYPDFFQPYFKRNDKGHKTKSTTVTIRDTSGKPVGLLCINLDIEPLESLKQTITSFAESMGSTELPSFLFKEDWQQRIQHYVFDYLQKHHLSMDSLKKNQRLTLVQHLLEDGAFNSPKSADYVANVLSVSRATVYNDLAKLDKQKKPS